MNEKKSLAPLKTSRPAPCNPALFAGLPALHPATPFEKGVDPKTLSADGQHTFYGKAKNPVCRNRCFLGAGLWIPVAVPSVGVLCSRAWWEASSESPWVFGDASRLHDLKRPSLFRRDEVPARNTHKIVRLRLYALKKVFEGSKGRFFKNAPWQGVGQRPTKGGRASPSGRAFSGGTKSLHETPTRLSGFAFTPQKSF